MATIDLKYYYQFKEDDEALKLLKAEHNKMIDSLRTEINKIEGVRKAIQTLRGVTPTREV